MEICLAMACNCDLRYCRFTYTAVFEARNDGIAQELSGEVDADGGVWCGWGKIVTGDSTAQGVSQRFVVWSGVGGVWLEGETPQHSEFPRCLIRNSPNHQV